MKRMQETMASELEECAAAIFRIKGKDVVTKTEFVMDVNLNLKWMSNKEANNLLKVLVQNNILVENNNYIKPAKDLSSIQVGITYRPSAALIKSLSGSIEKSTSKPASGEQNVFMEMINIADSKGIPKGKFVSESNTLKKKLGVDVTVAALIILRDNGVDIKELENRVYTQILQK